MSARRSEIELFRAVAAAGNPADLAELGGRLRRCVHWVLRRMAGGHAVAGEAEDIVSDALLRLEQLRERGFSGGDREFRSYLYKVVVSACVEAMHHRRWTASLDAPVTLPDGEEKPLGEVVKGMVATGPIRASASGSAPPSGRSPRRSSAKRWRSTALPTSRPRRCRRCARRWPSTAPTTRRSSGSA